MYKILAENVMTLNENQWIPTKAILTAVSGGLQVHYTDKNGMILKKEAYSRSPYYKKEETATK